jgi:hypothetical protein
MTRRTELYVKQHTSKCTPASEAKLLDLVKELPRCCLHEFTGLLFFFRRDLAILDFVFVKVLVFFVLILLINLGCNIRCRTPRSQHAPSNNSRRRFVLLNFAPYSALPTVAIEV